MTLFSLLMRVIGFFMRIVLSRELGAEGLGMYQIALSFFYVFLTVVSSGLPTTISHLSAKYKVTGDKETEGKTVSASLILGLAFSVLLEVLIFCFKPLIVNATSPECFLIILCLSPSIFITAVYMSFRGALWGRQKHFANGLAEIGEQTTRFLLFVILLTTAKSPTIGAIRAGCCYTISCLVSMCVAIFFYFKNGSVLRSPKGMFKQVFKSSFPITMLHLLSSILQPIIAVVIPYKLQCAGYTEKEAIVLFGIVTGMTIPLLSLPSAVVGAYSTALTPEISESIAIKDREKLTNQIKTALSLTMFVEFCFVPIYLGAGQEIGSLLFNNTTSGYLLAKASLMMVPMGINEISQSILNSIDMQSKGFLNYVFGSCFLIVSLFILPQYFGIDAMILGTGISITISSILNVVAIAKKLQVKGIIIKPLCLMSLFVLPSSMLGHSLTQIFKYSMPQFFVVTLSSLASLLCFV
ncbi:MAG: oligosaccharide flippase family protein, partial [Clostridia bacterium]|nr:oligosaccharide flippase family protein [Clostridia bacterium]